MDYAKQGSNLKPAQNNLGRVCMPLVRLLTKDGLSWADRELIGSAIQDAIRVHDGMESEARHLAQGGMQQAMVAKLDKAMGY